MKFALAVRLLAALTVIASPAAADIRYTLAIIPAGRPAKGNQFGIDASPINSPLIVTVMRNDSHQRQDISVQVAGVNFSETRVVSCGTDEYMRIDPQLKIYCVTPLHSMNPEQLLEVLMPGMLALPADPGPLDPTLNNGDDTNTLNISYKDYGVHTLGKVELPAHHYLITFKKGTSKADTNTTKMELWISATTTGAELTNLIDTTRDITDTATGTVRHYLLYGELEPFQLLCSKMPVEEIFYAGGNARTTLNMTGFLPGDLDPSVFLHPAGFTEVTNGDFDHLRASFLQFKGLASSNFSSLLSFVELGPDQLGALEGGPKGTTHQTIFGGSSQASP